MDTKRDNTTKKKTDRQDRLNSLMKEAKDYREDSGNRLSNMKMNQSKITYSTNKPSRLDNSNYGMLSKQPDPGNSSGRELQGRKPSGSFLRHARSNQFESSFNGAAENSFDPMLKSN